MKRLLILITVTLAAQLALSCPMCNVFNYLYSNLRAAPNIMVATVQDEIDEQNASVRVDKVIRGKNKVGDVLKWKIWDSKDQKGKQFILLNMESSGSQPSEVLAVELEWEVLFLIRNAPYEKKEAEALEGLGEMGLDAEAILKYTEEKRRPVVKDAEEAVHAVQGVSEITRYLGLEYTKRHPDDCYPLLVKALRVRCTTFEGQASPAFTSRAVDGLVESMWTCGGNRVARLLPMVIVTFIADRDSGLGLDKIDLEPDLYAQYITSILEWSKHRPISKAELAATLIKSLPECRGKVLAAMIYATHRSGLITPEQVESAASNAVLSVPGEADAVALGFYHVGWHYGRWWDFKKALQAFEFANKHCRNKELKQLLEDRIKICKESTKPNVETSEHSVVPAPQVQR